MTEQQIAVDRVAEFLDFNDPCNCTDAYIRSLQRRLTEALGY